MRTVGGPRGQGSCGRPRSRSRRAGECRPGRRPGFSSSASRKAVAPSAASPMTLKPSACSRICRVPARSTSWSSTTSTVCRRLRAAWRPPRDADGSVGFVRTPRRAGHRIIHRRSAPSLSHEAREQSGGHRDGQRGGGGRAGERGARSLPGSTPTRCRLDAQAASSTERVGPCTPTTTAATTGSTPIPPSQQPG